MALTAEATALTIQQRQRQLALRAAILRELFGIWSAVDPSAIDR